MEYHHSRCLWDRCVRLYGGCTNNRVNRQKIDSLQTIRAFAFLGIFFWHTEIPLSSTFGGWGVSIFIVLSGFVMVYSYYNKNLSTKVKDMFLFSLKRIKKLYPLHIMMIVVAIVVSI